MKITINGHEIEGTPDEIAIMIGLVPDGNYVTTTSINMFDGVPNACRNCPNHPKNGGSGICHCTLGLPDIRC